MAGGTAGVGPGAEALDRAQAELAQVTHDEARVRRERLNKSSVVSSEFSGTAQNVVDYFRQPALFEEALNQHRPISQRATFAETQAAVKAAADADKAEAAENFAAGLKTATAAAALAAGALQQVATVANYMNSLQTQGAKSSAQIGGSVGMSIARMGGGKELQDYWRGRAQKGELGNLSPQEFAAILESASASGNYGLVPGAVEKALDVIAEQGISGQASAQELSSALSVGPVPGVQFGVRRIGAARTSAGTRGDVGFNAEMSQIQIRGQTAGAERGRSIARQQGLREEEAASGNWLQGWLNQMPGQGMWDRFWTWREQEIERLDNERAARRAARTQKVKLDTPPSTTGGQ